MTKGLTMRLIPALMMFGFAGVASASGFALQNTTGSGNGNAFAGAAAAAEDASTIFFNPAGMASLPRGHNISASGTLLNRSVDFKNRGSVDSANNRFGAYNTNGGDAGGLAVLPAGYWAYGINSDWTIGLGVGPTFGNTTEYDNEFIGRSAGFYFHMEQININPSVAYKLNEKVSLGAGVNFAQNKSHFKQGVSAVVPAFGYNAGNYLDVRGEDWAVGFNLGAMFQLSPSTRIGLAYRSQLNFELEGNENFNAAAAGGGPLPALSGANVDVKAKLKTPANFSLAVSQQLSDKWQLLGDVTWTDWSVVETLKVKSKATGATLQQLPYNFHDTYRVGLGANYQYNEALKLRFGVAYDKSPVKHASDRTMTLPDSDRTWLSFGAKYSLSKNSSLDLGYSHIFFAEAKTARAVNLGTTQTQTINGKFDVSADILSMQYNHTF